MKRDKFIARSPRSDTEEARFQRATKDLKKS
ncbi:hypothetical protein VPHD518_0049 [Vibrio phage D518]